jgi:amino acid transporter
MQDAPTKRQWIRNLFIGKARDISDKHIFHKLSLMALLAWVGLGSDGLSSSCYGPEECFKALGQHHALAPIIALMCVVTIAIISASYSQIIAAFPGGGGGYLVASKLLSPKVGACSGCALLVDYVLTIGISIASGADQMFSVLPPSWLPWKLPCALAATALLTLLNLRGVKESVLVWTPIFFVFLATHAFGILYGIGTHLGDVSQVVHETSRGMDEAHAQLGFLGVCALLLRAYSVGAGTYTGIEAVSNGLPVLREPRVATGRRTMLYMGASLSFMVGGLLIGYLLFHTRLEEGKTLNAVLFAQVTAGWPTASSHAFVFVAMLSAATLLFIAAQTGFVDGPRVLANMALDRWFPTRFATLSDRFVAHNGILLMGGAAFVLIALTRGSVGYLVVLYSINVFITFSLSQLGMVRHWWKDRATESQWRGRLVINAVGFSLTAFILVTLVAEKFTEGGWITLVVTGALIGLAFLIKAHYAAARHELKRLDELLEVLKPAHSTPPGVPDPHARTAVLFVNGYNGLGIHTLLNVQRMFPGVFRNFIFAEIGVVDTGNFKGSEEIENMKGSIERETSRYVDYMRAHGCCAEAACAIGTEVVSTAREMGSSILRKYPESTFFGGQLVFRNETYLTRLLHNYTVFLMQREFFRQGMPFFVLPIRV